MNKDQVKGRVEEAKGKVKEVTGKVLDDKGMEVEGKSKKTSARAGRDLVISRKTLRKTNKTPTAGPCSRFQKY